jgi:hypothetical protein
MADIGGQVKNIAQDLLNLEVNTIIKPNMTGRKMPVSRHALADIAEAYHLRLVDVGFPLKNSDDIIFGSFESFDLIRSRTDDGIDELKRRIAKKTEEDDDDVEVVTLIRIKRMSDQVIGLFKSLKRKNVEQWDNHISREDIDDAPPLGLAPDERVLVRKIWDMGLEEIAMQTVIQMDGDVITRIQSKYANKESIVIHRLHDESVNTAIRFWGELIGIVKDFFGKLVQS